MTYVVMRKAVHFITIAVEDDGIWDDSEFGEYLTIKQVLERVFKDPPAGTRAIVLGTDTISCGDRKLNLDKYKKALRKKK